MECIPSPKGDEDAPLKCLIFDSYYDAYKGVIVYVRVMDGELTPGTNIKFMATGKEFNVVEVGSLSPLGMIPCDSLKAGDVG